ncbi:helix-turn-helix domain-containing protein [Chryseobacterium sp.]|uniref:helix-turn-helix domain-containing protein n=1 Tax=Chryseobacterium sp. TaxID=1871047 RepID=UPI00321B7357
MRVISPEKITDSIKNETELYILQGLQNFEDRLLFIQKGMTLGILAAELKSNVKYVSVIIKTYKGESFKSYINKLRINYIITKLQSDPIYRKYKISHLADLSGFTTSSLFSKVFKEITGEKPSEYIASLKDRSQ